MATGTDADGREDVLRQAHARPAEEVIEALGSDAVAGLSGDAAAARAQTYGPNEIAAEPSPSLLRVAALQVREPMNLMLVAVAAVALVIAEVPTALLVAGLVALNVGLGARQELQARAAVHALADVAVPLARVVRDGRPTEQSVVAVVPGDLVAVAAGDIVPADGRILRAASLEVQEAALTGESVPVPKQVAPVTDPAAGLGDRASMLFQSTSVTRGSGVMVVTATGMATQMGRIATLLAEVDRTRSPLQRELDRLTRVLGVVAWGAVALITLIAVARGAALADVLLVGVAMAISAIPTGLPTFVATMLAHGASRLAAQQALVKNLADVETLGATSAINSDKTGTLTMNEMMVSSLYTRGSFFSVDGHGYDTHGQVRQVAGAATPDLTRLSYGLALCSDATVDGDGIVGDPTEAALVVLAAKLGVDAVETRRAYPRLAEVPFDSAYKFMATVHRVPIDGAQRLVCLVKGGPDVVLARCVAADAGPDHPQVPIAEAREAIESANARLGGQGLRVLAFAAAVLEEDALPAVQADPMQAVEGLTFVGLAGIIDPLRPASADAVADARRAGIEVRMITGDHVVTAAAIGRTLGLEGSAMSGAELATLSDDELAERVRDVGVFGRVTPDDKLRIVRSMQGNGQIVAMTGDAVNDAAALKQADIGVAMGSGSEVTKQAARLILTDDNFGTLVAAIAQGRRIYDRIGAYLAYQMAQLFALVLLFVTASVADLSGGVALTPLMVLFVNFFVALFPVLVIMTGQGDPDVMSRPPRDPAQGLANPATLGRWLLFGVVLFLVALLPLLAGPDTPSASAPSASMTMAFVVVGLGTLVTGFALRADPAAALTPPVLTPLAVLAVPVLLLVLATELDLAHRALMTQPLTGRQWLATLGLAAVPLVVIEFDKLRRRRARRSPRLADPERVLTPARAATTARRSVVGRNGG